MGVWKAEAGTPELVRLSSCTCPTEGLLQRFMPKCLCSMPNNATRASRGVSSEASHSAAIVRCGPTRRVPSVSVHFRLFSRDLNLCPTALRAPADQNCLLSAPRTEISQACVREALLAPKNPTQLGPPKFGQRSATQQRSLAMRLCNSRAF